MKTKLIALDLDHTTLQEDRSLSDRNKNALQRALNKGVQVVVASGRAYRTFSKEVLSIPGIRYAITGNGAGLYDTIEDKRLHACKLPGAMIDTILSYLDDDIVFECFMDGVAYSPAYYVADPVRYGGNPKSKAYTQSSRTPVPDIKAFAREHRDNIDSIQSFLHDQDRKMKLWREIESHTQGVRVTSALKGLLEFYSPEASKKNGVAFFCQYLGISPEDAVSFGDAENDREMMNYTGRCVAVRNAIEPLKEMADFVTLNSWDDGVDFAFREFLNI
jgi:Cof subfamily protein (haloacid dehalogenase superfamily)